MHPLCESFADRWPVDSWRAVNVVIAVSGGADSVALLRSALALKGEAGGDGELVVAHYEHGCRGADSREDAAWVARLAEGLGLRCDLGRSPESGPRSEGALRDERRAFYQAAARRAGARYLATAHTADDQAETVLFRALRGAGLGGLRGIAPFAPLSPSCTLARPLLEATRCEVLDYLRAIDQPHRTDRTNASTDPTRNWIRHELLPLAETRFPTAQAALRRLAQRSAEASDLIERFASALLERALVGSIDGGDDSIRLKRAVLAGSDPLVVRETLRLAWRRAGWPEGGVGADHWGLLAGVATDGVPQTTTLPGAVRAEATAEGLLVLRRAPPGAGGK